MNPNNNLLQTNEIVEQTLKAIKTIETIVGKKWLDKRLQKIYQKNEQNKKKPLDKMRSGSYLFEPKSHPMVQTIFFVKEWLNQIKQQPAILLNPIIEPNEHVLKVIYIARILEASKQIKGFKKVSTRLLDISQYDSTFFEAEVAAIYYKKNFEVEFVEESQEKSPDLKITKNGVNVWVECKTRKNLTNKQEKHNAYWDDLKASLLKKLRPNKINVAIVINAAEELEREEIQPLHNFIIDSIKSGGIGNYDIKTGKVNFEYDPTKKFAIAISVLSKADEVKISNFNIILPDKDYSFISDCDFSNQSNTIFSFQNPFILMHKTISKQDNIKGIIHTFKTAVKQIPTKGPGIIWIKTLNNNSKDKFEDSFNEIEKVLKKELKGNKNQKVNYVVIHTVSLVNMLFTPNIKNLKIEPIQKSIRHENPYIHL